jgi:hypothetical protein
MMDARAGYLFMLGAAALAAVLFALAFRQRSWGLWLSAFTMLLGAIWMAWSFRRP